jgi:hypothetical protein
MEERRAGSVVHEGNGCWSYIPTQGETNYNHVAFTFVNSSAVSVTVQVYTIAGDPSDAVRLGLTALPNAAAGANGGVPTVDANNAVKLQSGTGANQISLSSGAVTVGTNNDKTGYTASTVGDKTGYSLASDQSAVTIGTVNALGTQAKADVNAEAVDALATDTYAEPASVIAATSSLKDKLCWLFTLARNKITQTSTTQTLRNDADSANIATAAVSDDATTFTRAEWS